MSPAHVLEPTYRRLKRALMDGTWPMGAKLEALRLADDFGVSATPVRDSLNQLVGEGLVDLTPGEGFRVAVLSEQGLRDILRVNLLLLSGAVDGGWWRRTNETEGLPDDYAGQLAEVFAVLASGSGNRFLVRQIEQISERLHVVRNSELAVMHEAALHLAALDQSLDGSGRERREALVRYHKASLGHVAQLIAHISQ